jgi:hypothetical protein
MNRETAKGENQRALHQEQRGKPEKNKETAAIGHGGDQNAGT